MLDIKDIEDRIKSDFGERDQEVHRIFETEILRFDYLNNSRIIRCILFLAEKDIEKLKKNIEVAINDPRDVMFWAEYTKRETLENAKRIRDFNKPFEKSEINVKE